MFIKHKLKRLANRGDTIVEVLIAVVVLSFVLTTAYALATQAVSENEDTQEHSQALRIAQGQIESFKSYAASHPSSPSGTGTGFCFRQSDGAVFNFSSPNEPSATMPDVLKLPPYPANCTQVFGTTSTTCTGQANCFYFGIRQGTLTNANLYTVTVRWYGARGGQQDQTSLLYRLYP